MVFGNFSLVGGLRRLKQKVKFLTNDSVGRRALEKRCYTVPGRLIQPLKDGKTEQTIVLTDGPNGCLHRGTRALMKYFTLGIF